MAEYEDSIIIKRWPDEIFQFVTNLKNLPKYLPSPYKEQFAGVDHCHGMRASRSQNIESDNISFESDSYTDSTEGWCRIDAVEYVMEWAAGGDSNYSGWLQIEELDGASEVILHINYTPDPEMLRRMIQQNGSVSSAMQKYLAESLHAIKYNVESLAQTSNH